MQEKTCGPELGPLATECFSVDVCQYKNTEDVVRLVVSEFHDKLYLSIRRWYWSTWEEDYFPTGDGITFPYNDETVEGLLKAFSNLLSNKELELLYEFRNRKTNQTLSD